MSDLYLLTSFFCHDCVVKKLHKTDNNYESIKHKKDCRNLDLLNFRLLRAVKEIKITEAFKDLLLEVSNDYY